MLAESKDEKGRTEVGGGAKNARESLRDRGSRLGKALDASDTGPLLVAGEVVELANEWEAWRAEAGGLTCDGWCRMALGKPLGFFRRRAEAVKILGEACRRVLHHQVAVWLTGKTLTDEKRGECLRALVTAARTRGGHPLSLSAAVNLINPLIGHTPRGTVCAGCCLLEIKVEQLEAALAALRDAGVDVDTVVQAAREGALPLG